MGWCFKPMDTMVLAKHCKDIGLVEVKYKDRVTKKNGFLENNFAA